MGCAILVGSSHYLCHPRFVYYIFLHRNILVRAVQVARLAYSVMMDVNYLFVLAICFCLTTISFLSLSERQRGLLFNRFRLRGRRSSSANTPPRSLSPHKGTPDNAPLTSLEYVDIFPPARREALVEAAKSLPSKQRIKIGRVEASQDVLKRSIMPFDADWSKCSGSLRTSTGIAVDEIRALGDFPDYAGLCGVPLPEAYEGFDIKHAIPRPYRPFRWTYHQTMCRSKRLFLICFSDKTSTFQA